jgi:hypothetical protein
MRQNKTRRIIMVGPDINRMGGIATICRLMTSGWDHSRYQMQYIATIRDGSIFLKITTFIGAIIRFLRLVFWKPQLVHLHFSWKGSFFRKSLFVLLAKLFRMRVVLHCNSSRFDVF